MRCDDSPGACQPSLQRAHVERGQCGNENLYAQAFGKPVPNRASVRTLLPGMFTSSW